MPALMFIPLTCALFLPADTGRVNTSLTNLESDLKQFTADSLIGPEAQAVLQQMPRYHRLLRGADSLSRIDNFQVDLIGQWHWGPNPTRYELKQIRSSQRQVGHLLDSLVYDVVGAEVAMLTGRITPTSIRAMVEDEERHQSFFVSERAVERRLDLIREYDGVINYLWRRPNSHVISCEDQTMWKLGCRYYQVQTNSTAEHRNSIGQPWLDLEVSFRIARTEIALATIIIELHQAGRRRGVVVMGAWHSYEWPEVTGHYRIQTQYFPSIDLSKGQLEEARRIRTIMKTTNRD